jgi:peptidoglycan/LPS O-acetylase OafA/YrhL
MHERMPERFVPAIALVMGITFAVASLSWYFVEKPAMRLGARVPARTQPQSARQPC